MDPVWSKLDRGLLNIYTNYLELQTSAKQDGVFVHSALKNQNKTIFITLQYSGDLSQLESIGFDMQSIEKPGVANGYINLDKIAEFSHNPAVIKLSYGEESTPFLNTSVLEILARGTTPGTNCVWSVNQSTGVFGGMTGENVIIGIIDTGIEWRHSNFMEHDQNTTRILRIWDQGLVPQGAEHSPAVALLTGGPTYGVEYSDTNINIELAAPAIPSTIRHRDCNGHGTHVAGIASGNGKQTRFVVELPFLYTGVAPKAKLVIVKYLYLENDPGVNYLKRFKDAIRYILSIAAAEGKPVVINCSFGSTLGAHDGMIDDGIDGQQTFLETTFSAAAGKICVFAAGNDSGNRHHGNITIPGVGSIEVPFELYDPRAVRNDYNKCTVEDNTKPLSLGFWYQNSVAGLGVQFKPRGAAAYSASVLPGGAPLINQPFDVNKKFSVFHNVKTVQRLAAPLRRNNVSINIEPHANLHRTGTYMVKLSGPAGAVIYVWCLQLRGYGFKIDPAFVSPDVQISDNNTIGQPGDTPSVITVAAYDDTNDQMACFSSKGPLTDYSGLGVIANKPDLCAPGFNIISANSFQTDPGGDKYSSPLRLNYTAKGGTSMASPHIAGLVALLLQKDGTLTVTQVKTELNNAIRLRPHIYPNLQACNQPVIAVQPVATANEAGSGKPDAKTTWNNI